tara:strand:+ start:3403 stop:3741 length:339 start_codon:yes stop_codon:yes gene_type:complete
MTLPIIWKPDNRVDREQLSFMFESTFIRFHVRIKTAFNEPEKCFLADGNRILRVVLILLDWPGFHNHARALIPHNRVDFQGIFYIKRFYLAVVVSERGSECGERNQEICISI